MIGNLYRDLRQAVRSLRKKPGFTLVTLVTLGLGIGATTAVFSVVNSVLLRPLPFKDPDKLVWVWSRRPDNKRAPFSLPDFLDYRDQNQTLGEIAAFSNIGLNLSASERTERLPGLRVSANLFQVLGIDAGLGRLMLPQDDDPDKRHVVVLTYECWRNRFGSDKQIVGKSLTLNGETYEVIGVLPSNFSLPNPDAELAVPLAPDVDPLRDVRNSTNFLRAIARLKEGVSRSQAETDLSSIVSRQRDTYGESYLKKTGINLVPLYNELVGKVRTSLLVLFGSVLLVLLIACSNLAALSLARASSRSNEMAIKKALGATSPRLVVQLLTESLVLTSFGCLVGVLLAIFGIRGLLALSPVILPRYQEIGVDLRALAVAVAASLLAGAIVGVLPAWQTTKAELNSGLRTGGRGVGEGARLNRWRSTLVIGEVALCFVLLIGSGLLVQSFVRVNGIEPGFDSANTLSFRLSLPGLTYGDRASVTLFTQKLLSALQSLPEVEDAGAVSILPMSGSSVIINFGVVGRSSSLNDTYSAHLRAATPGYLRTMKIPLLHGRWFDERDKPETPVVALVSQSMAQRLWPNGDAIGARINVDDNNTGPRPLEIVGVVGNVKQLDLEGEQTMDIYIPMAQLHEDNVNMITNSQYWVVRSRADRRSLETAFMQELKKVDRDVATSNIRSLEDYLSATLAPRKFSLRVLSMFSITTLLLAVTGIYGLISYTVNQRTPEIGIRLALGAGRVGVFKLILAQGLSVVSIGIVLGVGGALVVVRVMSSLLFGVTPNDPLTFLSVALLLIGVAIVACGIPARRATRVDPIIVLRSE